MTEEEFQFWQGAFLAAIAGFSSDPDIRPSEIAGNAEILANDAIEVWRENRPS